MTTLHLLSCRATDEDCLRECLAAASPGDALVLLGDACHLAIGEHPLAAALFDDARALAVHALAEDCLLRGIDARIDGRAARIDYAHLVELAVAHPRSVSWF